VFTIAIVDDHPMTRQGIEWFIASQPEFTVLASVNSVEELQSVPEIDVVVLALYLGAGTPCFSAIEQLCERMRVLAIAPSDDAGDLVTAIRAGALGYLTQSAEGREIVTALAAVAQGAMYVASGFGGHIRGRLVHPVVKDPARLAPREVETLRWIASGYTHSQIARRMGLTQTTVDTYVKRIRAKLDAGNKAELTRMAIALSLDTPPIATMRLAHSGAGL
jgi:DNA-binding NarL/FixJ family response regulator